LYNNYGDVILRSSHESITVTFGIVEMSVLRPSHDSITITSGIMEMSVLMTKSWQYDNCGNFRT